MNFDDILRQLQGFMGSSDQCDTPENRKLAERLLEVISALNQRLRSCEELISKGKLSEAVAEAESQPQLISSVKRLSAMDLNHFSKICELYDWTRPPAILSDLAAKIGQAYERKDALAPLEAEYRRLVHTGTLAQKISVLRRIVRLKEDEGVLKENLVEFEGQRLSELTNAAKDAIVAKDEALLSEIHAEISSSEWTVKPEEKVIAKIEDVLREHRARNLGVRGRRILVGIADAYSNLDLAPLKESVSQWDQILKNPEFTPSENDLKQVAEARSWLDAELKKRVDKENFEALCAEIDGMFEDSAPFQDINRTYNAMMNTGMEIPELVRKRYENALEQHEVAAARAFKVKLASSVLLILLFAGFLSFFIIQRVKTQSLRRWQQAISGAIESGDLDHAGDLLGKLEKEDKEIYGKPEIQACHGELKSMLDSRAESSRKFKELSDDIRSNIEPDIGDYAKLKADFEAAEKLARTAGEKAEIEHFRRRISLHEEAIAKTRTDEFLKISKEMDEICLDMGSMDPIARLGEYREKYRQFTTKLGELQRCDGVKEATYKDETGKQSNRKKLLDEELSRAEKEQEVFLRRTDELYDAGRGLARFKASISEYLQKYPSCSFSDEKKEVLKNFAFYESASLLKDFDPCHDPKFISRLQEFKPLTGIIGGSIWRDSFRKIFPYYEKLGDNSADLRTFFDNLHRNSPLLNYYELKFYNKKRAKSLTWVCELEKPPVMKRVDLVKIGGRKVMQKNQILFVRSNNIYDLNDWEDWKFEDDGRGMQDHWEADGGKFGKFSCRIETKLDDIFKPVGYYDEIKRLILPAKSDDFKPANFEKTLLDVCSCAKTAGGHPYRMLILLKFALKHLSQISWNADYSPALKKVNDFMSRMSGGRERFNFMKMDDAKVKECSEFLKSLELPHMQSLSLLDRDIRTVSLSRCLDFVGIVKREGGEISVSMKPMSFYSGEVWALVVNDGRASFIVAGKIESGSCHLSDMARSIVRDCQPLFAPLDKKNTAELSKEFKDRAKEEGIKEIKWPDSWPINAR